MLGEYVLPAPGGVWQETLIGALGTLGHKTHAARQALARSVAPGGCGRSATAGARACTSPPRRPRCCGRAPSASTPSATPWDWDGRWLLVVLRVPEERREVRHQMRTRLAWAGFGSLGGGLWITPHVERERELADVAGAARPPSSCRFRAELGALGDPPRRRRGVGPRRAGRRLPRLRRALRPHAPARPEAIPRADAARPRVAQVPVPRSRPARGMLPARWPRERAHELFHERHAVGRRRAGVFRGLCRRSVPGLPARRPGRRSRARITGAPPSLHEAARRPSPHRPRRPSCSSRHSSATSIASASGPPR